MIEPESRTLRWHLWWFKVPIGLVLIAGLLVYTGNWGDVPTLFPVLAVWMAWSIVSGLYPWSMRLG